MKTSLLTSLAISFAIWGAPEPVLHVNSGSADRVAVCTELDNTKRLTVALGNKDAGAVDALVADGTCFAIARNTTIRRREPAPADGFSPVTIADGPRKGTKIWVPATMITPKPAGPIILPPSGLRVGDIAEVASQSATVCLDFASMDKFLLLVLYDRPRLPQFNAERQCFPVPAGSHVQIGNYDPGSRFYRVQVVSGIWFGWHVWTLESNLQPSSPASNFERAVKTGPFTTLGGSAGEIPACATKEAFFAFGNAIARQESVPTVLKQLPSCRIFANGTRVRRISSREPDHRLQLFSVSEGDSVGKSFYTSIEMVHEVGPGKPNAVAQPSWR